MGWVSNVAGSFTGSNQRKAAADARNALEASKREGIGYLTPWANAGGAALAPLTGLLTGNSFDYTTGKSTPVSGDQRMDLFQTSPGYQFRMDQAIKAIQGSQAAKGNLLSGGGLKELTEFSQGVASDEYGNFLSQLFNLAGMGQQADTSRSNLAMGFAAPTAQAAFSSGIASDVGASRIFDLAGGIAGMFSGGGGGGNPKINPNSTGGGGVYNPSIFMSAAGA